MIHQLILLQSAPPQAGESTTELYPPVADTAEYISLAMPATLGISISESGIISSMKTAYLLQGAIFLGVILIAAYALQSKQESGAFGIMDAAEPTAMTTTLSITSAAFEQNGRIPSKYTCDGDRSVSPPLVFSGVPEKAKSLVLIMDDPDVPKALHADGVFDHWVLFNIPPSVSEVGEGKSAGTAGANGGGRNAYTGPCPPPQYEPKEHRYVFALYALDTMLMLNEGATKQEVLKAIDGHIIQQSELIGRYSRE